MPPLLSTRLVMLCVHIYSSLHASLMPYMTMCTDVDIGAGGMSG